MTPIETNRLNYQDALRVIGRRLDAEPTYQFSVHENEQGFCAEFFPSRFRTDRRESDFPWERLQDLMVYHMAGRGLTRRHHRYRGIWANFPNGHEDFLRAVGYDLDQARASAVQIRETTNGVSLSYRAADQRERTSGDMNKEEIQALLAVAQSRRRRAS